MAKLMIKDKVIDYISGIAIPKPKPNQNTDDILPPRFLKEITFKNMGKYVFADERYQDGELVPDHPFNDEQYKGARVLIAGENFGCGSSREHAPQGLHRYGMDVIIAAESFAEIFEGNCTSVGVPCLTVSQENLDKLVGYAKQNTDFHIDLKKKVITYDDNKTPFDIPEARREAFVRGLWDVISVLKHYEKSVDKFAKRLSYLSFK